MKNITAVILAAGLGTRMKSDLPKVMHKVGGEFLIRRVINSLREAGIRDIIAVVGYKAGMIESSFKDDNITFVRQENLLGSGDAVKQACPYIKGEDVLVTCGDAPLITSGTFRRLADVHVREQVSATLLTCDVLDGAEYGRILRDGSGGVLRIVEAKDLAGDERNINEVNVGTYCFSTADLKEFIGQIKLNDKKREFYLTDIVELLISGGREIASEKCGEEEFVGINSRKELAMANGIVNSRTLERLMDSGVTIIDPGTTYIHESVQVGRDTTIYPCTVIERDVMVGDGCSIGPFARLRPGTRVADGAEIGNFVELCRTEIGEGSKVKHHTYLGDTVVGKNANIGAGTITANYDGRNKNRTFIGDETFIGVGAVLIAPVKIGNKATVGAGSVVTKNKDVPVGSTVVGVPARPFEPGRGRS